MFLHMSVCPRVVSASVHAGIPPPPSPANKSVLFPYSNISEAFVKSSYQYLSIELSSGQLQKDFNCEPVRQPVPKQFQDPPNEWKREIKRMCHSKT